MSEFGEAIFELLPGQLGLLWVGIPPQARMFNLMSVVAALACGAFKVERSLLKLAFAAGSAFILTYVIMVVLNSR